MAPAAERAAAALSLPGPTPVRRPEFDVMRGSVVAGLVVFHSAVVFSAGASWFVKDPRPGAGFTVFLLWGSLWGMPLLFLVSGMSARACDADPLRGGVRPETARLLVPFAFGLLVLVTPMFYIGRLGQPAFHQPYWRFRLSFVNVPAIARGLLPRGSWTSGGVSFDPAHLWFLYVLLLFTLALLPLFTYLGGPRGRLLTSALAGFAECHGAVVVLAAAIPLMAGEAAFGPDVNTGGWERVVYVFPFSYGFLIACDSRLENVLRRSRWPALAVACAATGPLVSWAGALEPVGHRSQRPRPARLERPAGTGRLGVDRGHHRVRRIHRHQPTPPAAPEGYSARRGARAPLAACRPVRQRSRTAVLPAA